MFTMGPPLWGGERDELFDYVVWLMHFDGAHGSRAYTDKSKYARTVAETGSNSISTTQAKFGGSSVVFNDGAVYALDASEIEFGAGNWCIEFFIYPTVYGGWVMSKRDTQVPLGGTVPAVGLELKGGSGSEKIRVVLSADGTTYGFDASFPSVGGGAYSVGSWSHIAVVRNGATITVYRDGASLGSSAVALTVLNSAERFSIGRLVTGSYMIGYIDEFRLTVGVPRYTAAFTPPSRAFPDS